MNEKKVSKSDKLKRMDGYTWLDIRQENLTSSMKYYTHASRASNMKALYQNRLGR